MITTSLLPSSPFFVSSTFSPLHSPFCSPRLSPLLFLHLPYSPPSPLHTSSISSALPSLLQITFLNKFVASLMETLENSDLGRGYFSNTIPHVHVMEFTQHYIFTRSVHRRNNLLQLILGRSHLPMAFPTDPADQMVPPQHSYLPGQLGPLVNLHMLQEDILVTCLTGMPVIEHSSMSSLRVPFKFKDDGSSLFRYLNEWCPCVTICTYVC